MSLAHAVVDPQEAATGNSQRRTARASCTLEAMVRSHGREYFCLIDDISVLGCRLTGINVKRLGDRVTVTILDRAIEPIEAELVWRSCRAAGLEFLHQRTTPIR